MPMRIEDYGLIGDGETAALVSREGSIDWLCWPRFDSDACFAHLLGDRTHGCWRIAPVAAQPGISRRYRGYTLILETRFETADGAVRLVDFMPPRSASADLVRLVVGERGSVPMEMSWTVRFGYGAFTPWISRLDDGSLRAIDGPDMAVLRARPPLDVRDGSAHGRFRVDAGQTLAFVMQYGASHLSPPACPDPLDALSRTETFWTRWASRFDGGGEWSDAILRSLITLKALIYAPTGGIVAAPTTSLPEHLGGTRNWDYRYCWLRDATLTLLALMRAGYFDEAQAWRNWLLRAVAGDPRQMQFLYGLAGERRLSEWCVDWLPGYGQSRPVRVGNAAYHQLQLDVYGELMNALHHARESGIEDGEWRWELPRALLDHLESIWTQPDEGIWEGRTERAHYTHSKVMAWVAVDRAVQSVESFALDGPLERWRALRARIHDEVCRHGYSAERGSFVRTYGGSDLDASLLMLPQLGFLPADDPRVQGTIAAVERELMVDGLVRRYDTQRSDDGLPPGEGSFLACSFWLASAYVLSGRLGDARRLLERLLGLRNDLGLLSEQYDVANRRMLGNFPQAFSHVGLIHTALALQEAEGAAGGSAEPDRSLRS